MQLSLSLIALAATFASALPTDPTPPPPSCDNGTSYCCTGNALISLQCVLAVLSPVCGQKICCINNGDGHQTCYNDSGIKINVPITIDIL